MTGEGLGRLFVGIGSAWMLVILIIGILGGLDKPSLWIGVLVDVSGSEIPRHLYLALTYLVVPVGLLTYLKDVLGDPVALWVKAAAPGGFLAVFLLFLVAAQPEVGQAPLLAVASLVPLQGMSTALEATGSWFLRFLVALAVLAGIPGVVGGVVGLIGGGGPGRRR